MNKLNKNTQPPISKDGVDIIVPVYNAVNDVALCVKSVLQHIGSDDRLVLIDDASTEAEIGLLMEALAKEAPSNLVILRNDENQGFTKTANLGMRYSSDRDVVLLNSDTIVTQDWMNALRRCVASDPKIGTATPFSNNAEICSYPNFCVNNAWVDGEDPERIRAALAKAAVPSYPDIPTGVGFCLYIKRSLIEAIGYFDEIFGAGYGEENDFCLRAQNAGFRNVLCDDAFVVHTGGRSFAGKKIELSERNMPLLLSKHPSYLEEVQRYIEQDSLFAIREAGRLEERKAEISQGVLHVLHTQGGGTETHVRDLLRASSDGRRHYMALAKGALWRIEWYDDDLRVLRFERQSSEPWSAFIEGLCETLGISFIHIHHLSGCREGILDALQTTSIPYGYTIHDLDAACPVITLINERGNYCRANTDTHICKECLRAQRMLVDIEVYRSTHYAFVKRASFLIAPSQWAAETFQKYFPGIEAQVIPHSVAKQVQPPKALRAFVLPDDGVPTIAVLGAIGPNKGARRLERLVALARSQSAAIRFVLIGYLDSEQGPWQSDDVVFTVHGRYAPQELPALLKHYKVRLVFFPSRGPETFSYTLSEAWLAGNVVLVPQLGALAERVQECDGGWVMTAEESESEELMLCRLLKALNETSKKSAPSLEAIKGGAPYFMSGDGRCKEGFTAQRVRDAFGYCEWRREGMGCGGVKFQEERKEASTGIAAWVIGKRHTTAGRVLRNWLPNSAIKAIKKYFF